MKRNLYHLLTLLLITLLFSTRLIPAAGQDVTGELLGRINNLRRSLGVHEYGLNGILSAAAQNQAQWMVSTGQVNHTQSDGSTPRSRAASLGYPSGAVSENIYMGSMASIDAAWGFWMNSAIHYRGITNTAYTQVGIGHAVGEHGQAFVLVFGNPNGWGVIPGMASNPQASAGSNPSSSANSAPPSFVVGVDEVGNIMHEIQPGDTLGDIVFIYGYDWDDLERIRQLNNLTEEQGRNLAVGEILLIPPYNGTFTPTPGSPPPPEPTQVINQVTPGPTENAIVLYSDALEFQSPTAEAQDMGILDTLTWTPSPTHTQTPALMPGPSTTSAVLLATPTPAETQAAWIVVTVTPTPLVVAMADGGAQSIMTANPPGEVVVKQTIPTWLMIVIAAQAIVIIGAGIQFIRRR